MRNHLRFWRSDKREHLPQSVCPTSKLTVLSLTQFSTFRRHCHGVMASRSTGSVSGLQESEQYDVLKSFRTTPPSGLMYTDSLV